MTPRPDYEHGLTSLRDATREWWESYRPSKYLPPTEPVTPTWVLLGMDKPQYVIDEEREQEGKLDERPSD